jgi:hypothetical protein
MILVQRLGHYGWSREHEWSEIFGDCDEAALTVVYGQTQQVFTVSEALHRPLQGLNRIPVEFALNIPRQTLAQHLGASLKISAQALLLHQDLVVRGR